MAETLGVVKIRFETIVERLLAGMKFAGGSFYIFFDGIN